MNDFGDLDDHPFTTTDDRFGGFGVSDGFGRSYLSSTDYLFYSVTVSILPLGSTSDLFGVLSPYTHLSPALITLPMFVPLPDPVRPFGGRGRPKTDPLGGLSNFLYFMMFIIYFRNKYNALDFKTLFF